MSSLEGFRTPLTQWADAGIQGTTMHAALARNHGNSGSYSAVRRFLQGLPQPLNATMRLSFEPGEAVQVDFGAGPAIVDPATGEIGKTWFFVMTLCWSRHQYVEMVRDQTVATWLECHRHAFEWFGGVPRKVTIEKCATFCARSCVLGRCAGGRRGAPRQKKCQGRLPCASPKTYRTVAYSAEHRGVSQP